MQIGFLPQRPPLHMDLTVEEYLTYAAHLRKIPANEVATAVQEAMERCRITHFANRLIRNLSGGYQQRVGIAQSIIHQPALVVLDEPTNGLDPNQIIEIRTLIKNLGKHHTVILSSHILQEIEAVCDRIIIINDGKIVADDTAAALSEKYSSDRRLMARIAGDEKRITDILTHLNGVADVVCYGEKEDGVFE